MIAAKPVNWLVALAGSVLVHFLIFAIWQLWPRTMVTAAAGAAVPLVDPLAASESGEGEIFVMSDHANIQRAELSSVPYVSAASFNAPAMAVDPVPAGRSSVPMTSAEAGGQGGANSSSKAASFFGVPSAGQRIVFVIDASASMGKNGRFGAAAKELAACLGNLPAAAAAQFQVILYNDVPRFLLPRGPQWLAINGERMDDVRNTLVEVVPEGRTEHAAALHLALVLSPRPDVIYLLTDGDDLRPEQVRFLQAASRGTAIHVIRLTDGARRDGPSPWQDLARACGGVYREVP